MSDLLERAKQMPSSLNDACRTIDLMAEEIARLREQLADAEEVRDEWCCEYTAARDRLRDKTGILNGDTMAEYTDSKRIQINDLEQAILAALRRGHDEFALNGFDAMAITMTQTIREVRDLAQMGRRAAPPSPELREALEKVIASLTKSSLTNHERIEDALLVARAALSGGKNG